MSRAGLLITIIHPAPDLESTPIRPWESLETEMIRLAEREPKCPTKEHSSPMTTSPER